MGNFRFVVASYEVYDIVVTKTRRYLKFILILILKKLNKRFVVFYYLLALFKIYLNYVNILSRLPTQMWYTVRTWSLNKSNNLEFEDILKTFKFSASIAHFILSLETLIEFNHYEFITSSIDK